MRPTDEKLEVSARWLLAADGLERRARESEDADLWEGMAEDARGRATSCLLDTSDAHRVRPWTVEEKAYLLAYERHELDYLRLCEQMAVGASPGEVGAIIDDLDTTCREVKALKSRIDSQLPS